MTEEAQKKYNEKLNRIETAISLAEGDRVPFIPKVSGFIASGYGISSYDMMKDYRTIEPGLRQFLQDYDPDMCWTPSTYPLDPLETLGIQSMRWPGPEHHLSLDSSFQIKDGCYMEDDEFEEFLLDPTHFLLTKFLPRKNKALKGFSKMYFREIYELSYLMEFGFFDDPEVKESLFACMQTGRQISNRKKQNGYIGGIVRELGYPSRGAAMVAPFDIYADSLRGLIQAVIDIRECPEEVLAVVDRLAKLNVKREIAAYKARGEKFIFIPLHAGVDEFMSREDYLKFYWPGLKMMIEGIVEAGMTPYVFCEGKYNTRLDILKDVPKGKVIYMFEQVDIAQAKKVLGDTACICGNLPTALLSYGKPEDVVEATKKMLYECAPGGGFIMDCSIIIDAASHENMHAWRDTVMKEGVYH